MKKIALEIVQITLLAAVLGAVSYACRKNRFKKTVFLEELYNYKTSPEIQTALSQSNTLAGSWDNYAANSTSGNFATAKTDFLNLFEHMERITFYNLGDVSAIYVFNRFYKTKIDTTEVINAYNAQESFDANTVGSYANNIKGVFAVEYLLYGETFSDSLETPKYINFVDAHLDHLTNSITAFQTSWKTYHTNFIESEGEGVSDSYNIVINRMIHILEDLINKRIQKPMKTNDPSIVPGYFSDQGLSKIKTQVQQLNAVYHGNGTEDFNSVYNSVRKKKKKLADNITTKFEETISYGNGMTNELTWYLENDTAPLTTYKGLLVDLLTYFKADVQKELDIIITFGDTDGD